MKKVFANKILTAIDVGTTKICVLIGHKLEEGQVEILGIGKVPSEGLRKGVVVDIAKAARSIKKAVNEAQMMADVVVESATIGISGAHIQSRNAYGAVPLEHGQVRQEDINAVIAAAKAIPLAEGQKVLHVLPQYFSLDGQDRLSDPLGMHGIRLEVQVHIITGSFASVQDLVKCCQMAEVKVQDVVLEQLASAQAVLNDDERELGVAMLDIGGGTADLAIYQKGSIRHTMVVPIAGNHFTNDLAIGLRTTVSDAERIKREYGLACSSLLQQDKEIEVEMVQGGKTRMVHQSQLVSILEPRAQELLSLVHEEILHRNLEHLLVSGLVITGGGALLDGLQEVAQDIFQVPVRIGRPAHIHDVSSMLQSPIYATGYGLLLHATHQQHSFNFDDQDKRGMSGLLTRMKSWVSDFF
ncbi:MAG: cell division protein FtsA [Candidatus Babeliales bacterium]|jgi:cell division protein FtsA